jgi:hypothetical protein
MVILGSFPISYKDYLYKNITGVFFVPTSYNGTISEIIASFRIPPEIIVEGALVQRNMKHPDRQACLLSVT